MKTQAEIKFEEIVKTCFHRKLKVLDFIKKANNFYRKFGEVGHVINIQKSIYGSRDHISFTVNVGVYTVPYWSAQYNYNNSEPPSYPNEAVSTIRMRIGQFMEGNDKWYDVISETDIEQINNELIYTLDHKILPYLDGLISMPDVIRYLENDYNSWDSNYIKFVLYGELGIVDKLNSIYHLLIKKCSKHQLNSIKEKAIKYGVLQL